MENYHSAQLVKNMHRVSQCNVAILIELTRIMGLYCLFWLRDFWIVLVIGSLFFHIYRDCRYQAH